MYLSLYRRYEPGEAADAVGGKHPHVLSCVMELEAEWKIALERSQCVLFDDDAKNIKVRVRG